MTQQEKAKELVEKYKSVFTFFKEQSVIDKYSKEAAITEVEEMIKVDWQQVKEEIKKL
jgi:predicted DNA-binding protein YlxM (UPF0122 family)